MFATARGVSRVCLCAETVAGGPASMQGDAYIRYVCCASERARDENVLCELGGGRLDVEDVALFAKDGGFGRERRFCCALMDYAIVNMHMLYPLRWSDGRCELYCESYGVGQVHGFK